MNEQVSMFTDPVDEQALKILRRAVADGIKKTFDSYYGGTSSGFSFCFDPRTKYFYYAGECFNSYNPEPWVRRKSLAEIKSLFMEE